MFDLSKFFAEQKVRKCSDDLRIIKNWAEYSEDNRRMKYLLYEMEMEEPDGQVVHFYKALKLLRVIRLPKSAKQSEAFMSMHSQILGGMWSQNINFTTIIANILNPKAIGLVFCYGVQGVASSIEDAKRKADLDFAALQAALQGTYRTLQARILNFQELEWIREKIFSMQNLIVVRGIPKAKDGGVDAGSSGVGGESVNPDSEDTTEEFISGMVDHEYIVQVLSTPVKREHLERWLERSSKEMTRWNKQLQGTSSVNFGLSIPMMYMANLGASEGWSHSYTDATSVATTQGTTVTTSFGVNESESISNSFSEGLTKSIGSSITDSYSNSHSVSVGESFTTSNGISSTESWGTSESVSHAINHSISSSENYGGSLTHSSSDGITNTDSISHSDSFGTSESISSSDGFSSGTSTNITHTEGTNQSDSTSHSVSHTESTTEGTSSSHGGSDTITQGTTSTHTSGYSDGTTNGTSSGETNTTGQSTSDGWSQGWSHSNGGSSSDGTSDNRSAGYNGAWAGMSPYKDGQNIGEYYGNVGSDGSYDEFDISGNQAAGLIGLKDNYSATNGYGSSHTDSTSWSTGGSDGKSGSTTDSSSQGFSNTVSESSSHTTSESDSTGSSYSTSSGTNWSEGTSYSHGVSNGTSDATSHSVGTSVSDSVSNGTSQSISHSDSISHGINSSFSDSVSSSKGTTHSDSVSEGTSWSNGKGVSDGTSDSYSSGTTHSVSSGTSYSESRGTSSGESWSDGTSKSYGTSQSDSYSQTVSEGTGSSWGKSSSVSNGTSYSESNSQSRGQALGMTGAMTTGTSSTMGLGPSMSYSKSYQWLDQEVKNIFTLLEFQNQRLMKSLRGNGAFFTDIYIGTMDETAQSKASVLARTAWNNEDAVICPLQVLDLEPVEQTHLLYHFAAFSADNAKENLSGAMESYRYSTILLPDEFTAYTHLPRISEGGVFADVEDVPKFAVPSGLTGDIYIGNILSAERYSSENGYETPFEYRLDESELMHAVITGESRSGKTVAATRFISEATKIKRKRTGKRLRIVALDPKQDWRILGKFVEPERFHFYSLGNPEFLPINLNICKVPHNVNPQTWVDGIIEIYCRNYGLMERGKAILGETFFELYAEAGVFEDSPNWRDFVPERSSQVTLCKVYERLLKHKLELEDPTKSGKGKAGNEARDCYTRILDRMQVFGRKFSIETRLFGQVDGMGIDEMIGKDDVIVLESYGLESTFKNFIFGCITSGFFKYAQGHEKGFLADDQYETLMVIEEANEVLCGSDTAGGAAQMTFSGQSEFEKILDQAAGLGLFIFSITQKIADMPSSVVANSGIIFSGKISRAEDTQVVIRKIGREERIDNRDVLKWFPRSPIGWFVCRSSRNYNFLQVEPVLVHVAALNVAPPTNDELISILEKKRAINLLNEA